MVTQEGQSVDRAAFKRAVTEKPVFTKSQGALAFHKHGLGPLDIWEAQEANMVNAVYKATTPQKTYFVKVKFRTGFSLRVQADALRIIRSATDLPVGAVSICDEDDGPFGHPYLICDELPGKSARELFEKSGLAVQRQILREYGRIAAALHQIDHDGSELPRRGLHDWRERLTNCFLDDHELISALPPTARDRIPVIRDLLATTTAVVTPTVQSFQWGDAVLHNLLVDASGHVTGVIDFENACYGDLLEDQLHIESEFDVRKPREIYGTAEFREEFWDSYERHGGTRTKPDETYLAVRHAMQAAGISWFWTGARVLPPRTLTYIEDLECILRDYQR